MSIIHIDNLVCRGVVENNVRYCFTLRLGKQQSHVIQSIIVRRNVHRKKVNCSAFSFHNV